MTFYAVNQPFEIFHDLNGDPLEAGYIWIGEMNQNPITNPIQTFWDSDGYYPAAQPIRTISGYASKNGSPGNLYFSSANQNYSILIQDKNEKTLLSRNKNVELEIFLNNTLVTPQLYGAVPLSGDATQIIQTAVDLNTTVVLNDFFYISAYILLPAGHRLISYSGGGLIALNSMPNYSGYGSNHQGQMVIANGDNCGIIGLSLNGGDYDSGGFANINQNAFARRCKITNGGGSQAILDTGGANVDYSSNFIKYCHHGIQLWQTTKATVNANIVDIIDAGGIWTADAEKITISGNTVSNCGDVGIDFEGGIDCISIGNNVSFCRNGELSFFANGTGSGRVPKNLSHRGNIVKRASTFLAGINETPTACTSSGAAMWVSSLTSGSENINFSGNSVNCEFGYPIYTNELPKADCGLIIDGNTISSSTQFFRMQSAWYSIIQNNTFIGLSGSEALQNEYKNCEAGLIANNVFKYSIKKTTNYVIYYTTSSGGMSSIGPSIRNNTFINTDDFAFKHDPFQTTVRAIISGNKFTDKFTINAGLIATSNGYPILVDQTLLFSLVEGANDLANLSAIHFVGTIGHGLLSVWMGGAMGSSYEVIYTINHSSTATITSRDGSGSGSGIGASVSRYASFSGSTITIIDVDSGNVSTAGLTLHCSNTIV